MLPFWSTIVWRFDQNLIVNSPDNDRAGTLQYLREQAQGSFNDIGSSPLNWRIVQCGNTWRLNPLSPATAQGPTLSQGQGFTDLLLPLGYSCVRLKESLTKASSLL
jgi:hypothetical protein